MRDGCHHGELLRKVERHPLEPWLETPAATSAYAEVATGGCRRRRRPPE